MATRRRDGGWRRAVGAFLLVLLCAGALIGLELGLRPDGAPARAAAGVTEPEVPEPDPAVVVPTAVADPVVEVRPLVPERLVVDGLGVDAPVVPIDVTGGVLVPPASPQVLGWWQGGAAVGAEQGSALVTGHTVHSGGGALDDLETLRPGDEIVVAGRRRELSFRVASVQVLGKGELAERAGEVFDQSGPPRLVVITCEDWNGSGYDSNVLVTAYQSAG